MYNLHSERIRGKAIDLVMDAWEANRRTASAVTPMIHLIQDTSPRPASMMFDPISPASNDSELVGFIRAVHNWDTVLEEVVPAHSKGIQIVVSDGLRSATFLVASDSTRFLGWGDLHDRLFDQYRRSFSPADPSTGYLEYSFRIYPTADFFPSDVSVVSIGSCVAVVLFVLLLTGAFLIHDLHLQGQLRQQQEMLNLKQKFVRFISHEIRTPMNTMSIGLKLLMDELDHMLTFLQREIATRGFGYDYLPEAPSSVAVNEQPSSHDQAIDLGECKQDSDPAAVSQGELALRKDLAAKLESWCQLLTEIEESSESSLSIFNELLSYDNIQQEYMSIEKEALPAWEIISSSVQPLFIQARYGALLVVSLAKYG
jgi:signal transduction histidine kinase